MWIVTLLLIILYPNIAPAGTACKPALANLLKLYREQNREMMLTRIENATNKHKFLRSFIPYYYNRAHRLREVLPVYQRLHRHRGQIVGDAHVENFGFLVDNRGRPRLTMNDFDDTAEAPLFLDVLRLSQSASYVSDVPKAAALEAYRQGLLNQQRPLSRYLRELQERASRGGLRSKADFEIRRGQVRFRERQRPSFDTTPAEVTALETALREKFPGAALQDSYRTMKESGGSAFGTRYHALVQINGETQLVEFKEILSGGVLPPWSSRMPDGDRVRRGQARVLGEEFDRNLDVVNLNGRAFQLRIKVRGNQSIDLSEVRGRDIPAVIQDEFYLLGQLHRNSLGGTDAGVSAYAADLARVSTDDWEASVRIMKREIRRVYDDVND
jgi:hypothetical protein